jgi:hypothetical protein
MMRLKSPLTGFLITTLLIAALTALGPEEQSLGANVRIVYLHGAWVLAAEGMLGSSAAAGLLGLITRRERLHRWSAALGRSGIFFWVTYLPLSLWAMQANWNGLYLSEPRFRLAVIFAVTGVLLQTGLALLVRPVFTSLFNLAFFIALRFSLSFAETRMHPPPSPIFSSGILWFQVYFVGLILMALLAGWFLTRWWLSRAGTSAVGSLTLKK